MVKKSFGFMLLFLMILTPLWSQSPIQDILRLGADGGLSLPLGESTTYFKPGFFAEITGNFFFLKDLPLALDAGLGYAAFPLLTGPLLNVLAAELGAQYSIPIADVFGFKGFVHGGGYFGFLSGIESFPSISATSGIGLGLSGGASFFFSGIPSLQFELGGRYRNFLSLYSGIDIFLSAGMALPPAGPTQPASAKPETLPFKPAPLKTSVVPPGVSLGAVKFENVYPVFFKYYNSHSLGSLTLSNNAGSVMTNITLSFYMKQYMDAPKICATIAKLDAGKGVPIELLALFTDKILEITEGTLVNADITLSYTLNGKVVQKSINQAVRVFDRNAMAWFDDRCAAAYVSAKDPSILSFGKNVAGSIKAQANMAINMNFQIALGIHSALDLYGMNYVVDPASSYAGQSKDKASVDFLQFPRQSLEYRAGDCDDLSILYAALLESVGIETAFITVPGHIYLAFSLDLSPDDARKTFSRPDELIFQGGKSWLPVEITDRKNGFLMAWQSGAKQWRENLARVQAILYPVHEAWTVFEPVGLPGAGPVVTMPGNAALLAKCGSEVNKFIEKEIFAKVSSLQTEIKNTNNSPKATNALGVLYARYGLYDKAEAEFNRIVKTNEYPQALVNLGNIAYLKKDLVKAQAFYERAYAKDRANALVVLSLARINHDSENYGSVKKYYEELKKLNPELAIKFAYLDLKGEEASRAADANKVKEIQLWSE